MTKSVTPDNPFVSTYETSAGFWYRIVSTSCAMTPSTFACVAPYAVKVTYAE